jgi:hypothetical protein
MYPGSRVVAPSPQITQLYFRGEKEKRPWHRRANSEECMLTDKRDGWKTIYTFAAMPLSLVLAGFVVFGVVCVPLPAPIRDR